MTHWMKHIHSRILIVLLFYVGISVAGQEELNGDVANGEAKFNSICTACHELGPRDQVLIGPGLEKVYSRLNSEEGLDLAWFDKWIKNSKELVDAGDPYAVKVYKEFDETLMTPNNVTDQDVIDILTYLENPPQPEEESSGKNEVVNVVDPDKAGNNRIIWVGFIAILGVLLAISYQINKLVKLRQDPDLAPSEEEKITSISDWFEQNKQLANGLVTLLLVLSLYIVWAWLFGVGVDKGYKPEQPIYFSHKIHAGINNIDCQTCHSSAKYGKVSEIPSANVCMNCHKGIKEYKGDYLEPGKTREFYNAEIQKLFDHVGFDGKDYTGETKEIKWTRIHNMPDFVHFNHAQHIVVGEKAIMKSYNKTHEDAPIDVVCKACHGAIDTMNVVQMANDFTMEFCIECHRTTEVDMGNAYNAEYFKNVQGKLEKNPHYSKDATVTVDAIGGIECGKCHY